LSRAAFDRKFGDQLVPQAPTAAGVYRYLSPEQEVLYVGKAKNLRRRLASYRNATSKKSHRKLRTLVREAHSLVYETCASEAAALLRESELIRELRPAYNVEGAYTFLYPSLGLGECDKRTVLCFTTAPEAFAHLGLTWYGCFRSRPRVKAAFGALVDLLCLTSHREKATRLPAAPRLKGSRLVGLRQLPADIAASLPALFAGEQSAVLGKLARLLLAKPNALRDAAQVESNLKCVLHFYEVDAVRLRHALVAQGRLGSYVPQDERDALFIRATALAAEASLSPSRPQSP
jgi:predicted GIY-YIG superfamily endonuclease